jgi:hypothetical protein
MEGSLDRGSSRVSLAAVREKEGGRRREEREEKKGRKKKETEEKIEKFPNLEISEKIKDN